MKRLLFFTVIYISSIKCNLLAQVNYEEIAYKYAPFFIAKVESKSDWIVNLDFDNDWDLTNNKENFRSLDNKPINNINIYYGAIETKYYYIINYMVYHALDTKEIKPFNIYPDFNAPNQHEHESGAVTVYVLKSSGEVEFIITRVHNKSILTCPDEENCPEGGDRDGTFSYIGLLYNWCLGVDHEHRNHCLLFPMKARNMYHEGIDDLLYGTHPVVYITPQAHSVYPSDKTNMSRNSFYPPEEIYVPKTYRDYGNFGYTKYSLNDLTKIIKKHGVKGEKFSPAFFATDNKYDLTMDDFIDMDSLKIPTRLATSSSHVEPITDFPFNHLVNEISPLFFPIEAMKSINAYKSKDDSVIYNSWLKILE